MFLTAAALLEEVWGCASKDEGSWWVGLLMGRRRMLLELRVEEGWGLGVWGEQAVFVWVVGWVDWFSYEVV
jgi:hypothetical protein